MKKSIPLSETIFREVLTQPEFDRLFELRERVNKKCFKDRATLCGRPERYEDILAEERARRVETLLHQDIRSLATSRKPSGRAYLNIGDGDERSEAGQTEVSVGAGAPRDVYNALVRAYGNFLGVKVITKPSHHTARQSVRRRGDKRRHLHLAAH
ncbi:MAG: hypothetical protein SFW62_08975 [Alphaproteobacteria bacterium]|nr:hypothetical protein [Alphaproteobacteria bacterium]